MQPAQIEPQPWLGRAPQRCQQAGAVLVDLGIIDRNNRGQRIDGEPKSIILVEFPDMARAREWYRSPEYAKALAVRRTALDLRLIFVAGVDPWPVRPANPSY